MSNKGFADTETNIETPNDIGEAEKPLKNGTESGRVDINVLKAKLQKIESKKIDISSYIAVKGLKAKGNQLDQKEIKLINKLDPIPYQPPVNDLNNIEVVDEKIDSNEDNDGSNNQTKLDF